MKNSMRGFVACLIFIVSCFSFNANAQWERTNGPRADEVLCFGAKDSFVYAGTWYAGFYRSSDKGKHWIQKSNGLSDIGGLFRITSIDTIDSTIFVGTGWKGVFKSTDNGDTWNRIVNGVPYTIDFITGDTSFPYITDFIRSGSNLIAGTDQGIVYTNDKGQNWLTANGIPQGYGAYYLTKKNTTLYSVVPGDSIYKSVDDGQTWTSLPNKPGNQLQYLIASNSTSIIVHADTNKLFISNDDGATWQLLNTGIPNNAYIINSLLCNGQEIYVGTSFSSGIYYSPDNGNTWTTINNGLTLANFETLFINGTDIYAGGYVGTFYSSNNGGWWECRNDGVESFSSVQKIMVQGSNIYAMANNNKNLGMIHSADKGDTWTPINNGVPLWAPPNGWMTDFALLGNNIIRCLDRSGIYFSSDTGKTWQNRNNGLPCPGAQKITVSGTDIFITNDSCGVYVSHDTGITWVSVNNGLPAYWYTSGLSANDSVIYLGIQNSSTSFAYESRNKGASWTSLSQLFYGFYAVDFSGAVVISLFSNGVAISNDNGYTWNTFNSGIPIDSINANQPDMYSVATNGTDFFLGTFRHGIYKLENNVWVPIGTGLPLQNPNSWVNSMAFQDSILYAALEYEAVWKRNIDSLEIKTYTGNIFSDNNNNGIKDGGETGLANVIAKMKVSNSYYTTDSTGDYTTYADCDYDTIQAKTGSLYAIVTPAFYPVTQSDSGKDFAVYFIPNVKDLRLTVTNITAARPGFNDKIRITYKNKGTVSMNGNLKLVFDSAVSYLSSSPSPVSVDGDTINWTFSNLLPLETRNIDILFNVPASVSIGTNLFFCGYIYPIVGDTMPYDNQSCLEQTVVGSYDPNEKEVSPSIGISPQQINNNDSLTYTIHFQNTGTDTAFTVKIIDTLSYNLDVSTFEVLSASHPYTYDITGQGIVEYTFSNILLLDSNTNEIQSHGFIKYSILAKKSLVNGDTIFNTAYIYFDFNSPVVTNTTATPVSNLVSVQDILSDNNFLTIYPNPAADIVFINTDTREKPLLQVYNINGQCVYEKRLNQNANTAMDVSKYSKGLYIIKVLTNTSVGTAKLVIQ